MKILISEYYLTVRKSDGNVVGLFLEFFPFTFIIVLPSIKIRDKKLKRQ
jgi:hypothetical protein